MAQTQAYKLDLISIEGDGDFPCPRCGTNISPNETIEETYNIIEPKVNNDVLEEIVIRCKTCQSYIYLTGFSLLQKLSIE